MAAAGASCRQVSQLLLESRRAGNVGETVVDAWLPPHSGSGEDQGAAAAEGSLAGSPGAGFSSETKFLSQIGI